MYTHSHNKSRVDYGVEEKVRMSCSVWLLFAASFKAWNRPFWGRIEWMADMKWVKATHCAITFLEKSILASTIWRILIQILTIIKQHIESRQRIKSTSCLRWILNKHPLDLRDIGLAFHFVRFPSEMTQIDLFECFSEALICWRLILPGCCLMFLCYPFCNTLHRSKIT